MRRPTSLAQVAARSANSLAFHLSHAEFLDEFRRHQRFEMLAEEPCRLEAVYNAGNVADAYLAAAAVSLAREIQATPPAWAWDESRFNRQPGGGRRAPGGSGRSRRS